MLSNNDKTPELKKYIFHKKFFLEEKFVITENLQ